MLSRMNILFTLLFFVSLSSVLISPTLSADEGTIPSPAILTASDMIIATGQPSLVTMTSGSTHVPVWSLSGGSIGQSVAGLIPGFPKECAGVKVEIVVTTNDPQTNDSFEDVYRVHLTQMVPDDSFSSRSIIGSAVRTRLTPKPMMTRKIVLESFYEIIPDAPISVRIQREPGDEADTFTRPTGLVMVIVTPLPAPAKPDVVQDIKGYNSWPMMQALGNKLVCTYSRGSGHTIAEDARAVYARTSIDGGKTWTPETVVAQTPGGGEVTIGKGLDSKGNMLLWIRRIGKEWNHDLYRTADGVNFELITTPKLDVMPIQITDIISVPGVGLMSLWFAGDYSNEGPCHSWGKLVSTDDGQNWTQIVIEDQLEKADWPTEQSAVYLGDGKILAIARSELSSVFTERSQFQMTSTDYGKTWTRARTNITDVLASTPSLILNPKTGLLSNYYYHRGRGVLRVRVVEPEKVFESPLSWPVSKAVTLGSAVTFDAGNVNGTVIGDKHYLSFYSGKGSDTSVYTVEF